MTDWSSPMVQTFEYYTVDPGTWEEVALLDSVTSCSIDRDLDADTLGSASIDMTETIGEEYVRVYLVVTQNGVTERFPLATILVQTPSIKFDGMVKSTSLDAYTPLIELKENKPPLGYFVEKDANIMDSVVRITEENLRAPVVKAISNDKVYRDFVANGDDTWMSFLQDLAASAKFYFDLDERGRILFAPRQDTKALQPVWTFDDGNSSILYPETTLKRDLYGVPNVVEVIYADDNCQYYAIIVNDDPNSPISTVNRGRRITQRITNPEFSGEPTQSMVDEYAEKALKNISTIEYTVTYQHGYCPVRIGDCIRLNYERAGLTDIKARVIRQSIKCTPGCPVNETAVFTKNLWR